MATSRNWKAICERQPNASSSNTPPSYATRSASYAPKSSCLRDSEAEDFQREQPAGSISAGLLIAGIYCVMIMTGCCNAHELVQLGSCAGAGMLAAIASLLVWMIVVEEALWLATYTLLEVGSEAIHTGLAPEGRGIVPSAAKLVALTSVTLLEPEFAT